MTAGLPGAAVGGLFYLVSALLMPVVQLVRLRRGRRLPGHGRLVLRQSAMAAGILAALWVVGEGLGWLFVATRLHVVPQLAAQPQGLPQDVPNVVRATAFAVSMGTLILVLGVVQVLRLVVRRPAAER
jgi:hypothetical protein